MANIINITNFNSSELDIYARLSEKQLFHYHEPNLGLFIAESPKVIGTALDAGYEPVSLLVEEKHLEGQTKEIISRVGDIPIYTGTFELLSHITGFQMTCGALCAMRRKPMLSVENVCLNAKRIVVLDQVMNPTNVGAIFRSAAALNMDGILLTPGCSNPLYRRSIRVSMGTVFQIPWTYMESDISSLKALGFATAAMALRKNSVSIDDPSLMSEEKLAILMGTEGDGLAPSTIENCDYTVCIPMSHGVDSLNVAAASAVAFWQLGNQ